MTEIAGRLSTPETEYILAEMVKIVEDHIARAYANLLREANKPGGYIARQHYSEMRLIKVFSVNEFPIYGVRVEDPTNSGQSRQLCRRALEKAAVFAIQRNAGRAVPHIIWGSNDHFFMVGPAAWWGADKTVTEP